MRKYLIILSNMLILVLLCSSRIRIQVIDLMTTAMEMKKSTGKHLNSSTYYILVEYINISYIEISDYFIVFKFLLNFLETKERKITSMTMKRFLELKMLTNLMI